MDGRGTARSGPRARRRPAVPRPRAEAQLNVARPDDLYDPRFVRALFDEMASSYERVNYLTSFGFSARWRRQCSERLSLQPGATVHDWMTGMGEGWRYLARRRAGRTVGIDLSPRMLAVAHERRRQFDGVDIEIREADVLSAGLPDASADAVLCLFGLKTASVEQLDRFALELARVLRPGGSYSIIEVSVPPAPVLRIPYLFYLKQVIPILGRLLLGNPENYRMLGVYTERFGDCRRVRTRLEAAGLRATYTEYFFGCATGVWGSKPR